MENFKDSVLIFRKSKGMNQSEFAEKIGISRITLSGIERGTPASRDTIEKICKAFDITKEQLLSYTDKTNEASTIENPWRDALIESLRDDIAFYRELLRQKGPASFLKPLSIDMALKSDKKQTVRELRGGMLKAA